jgi:hypothetical protein
MTAAQPGGGLFGDVSLTREEYHLQQASTMTKKAFQAVVVAAARRAGWSVYHTADSSRSEPGYPDLHLVHPGLGRSVFRELKTQKGRLSPKQEEWLGMLTAAGCDADVWRPIHWFDTTIDQVLRPSGVTS